MRLTKKIGAVALATVVATTTVMPAFAASTKDTEYDCSGWWVTHTPSVEITKDEATYSCDTVTYENASSNWNTPIVVVYTSTEKFKGGEGILDTAGYSEYCVMRSDNYAWAVDNGDTGDGLEKWTEAGFKQDSSLPEDLDWEAWLAANKKGTKFEVSAVLNGNNAIVTLSNEKIVTKYTIPVDASKPVYFSMTGELCKLTNIKHECKSSDFVTTKKATCTAVGEAKCKVCGETKTIDKTAHTYNKVVKATTKADGSTGDCSVCGAKGGAVSAIKDATLSKTSYTYAAKPYKPSVTVKDKAGKTIPATYYTVSYKNNKSAGKATVTVKFKGIYDGTLTKTFTIKKASQKISKYVTSKRVKYLSVKKKSQTFKIGAKAKTSVKYSTVKKDSKKKVTVSKTGKVTVKKGTKKGTYSVKVKVSTKGNSNYKSASKTFTLKVKVR